LALQRAAQQTGCDKSIIPENVLPAAYPSRQLCARQLTNDSITCAGRIALMDEMPLLPKYNAVVVWKAKASLAYQREAPGAGDGNVRQVPGAFARTCVCMCSGPLMPSSWGGDCMDIWEWLLTFTSKSYDHQLIGAGRDFGVRRAALANVFDGVLRRLKPLP